MKRTRVIGTWLAVLIPVLAFGLRIRQAPGGAPAVESTSGAASSPGAFGVCPPFRLRDEQGSIIDPVQGVNIKAPYSPRQTCGAAGCHDYERITQGYHFTQGAGEDPPAVQKARLGWVLSPGNFGGHWCSPAPLYRYLSPKRNDSPATMDMTAFTFFTSTCGACHPGGGPAEFDRQGRRYDHWMADPASGFSPGGDNHFDGDYFKARWTETGVMEADCLLCHLPGYGYAERQAQLEAWNFRWSATAGAGLASVTGSVKDGTPVEVVYDRSKFKADGTLELPMVRSPRNEACLSCHAQPGWKKRGADFRARTDVHLRAGLRCVDCHPGGRSASDPRIAGREMHQFGKGDDPGGLVRNDLDDTMVGCRDCHDTGRLGAPPARHPWLPPLHLETIACQTCHIPERMVMPIQVQASDVFNAAPRIHSPGKKLWTFYGPDGRFRNHYGYLDMMGHDDKPTERFRPELARYKGRIYPVNRVHSTWPGIEVEGQSALMQPRMSDIYRMWSDHRADPSKYPALAGIVDDTGDGVPEINRPEEIEAMIESVTRLLTDIGYPMQGKRVVWVMDDRVYRTGTEYRIIDKEEWEASPFASVFKYSHDILPARAALGAGGCTDCHRIPSPFFDRPILAAAFDPADGQPRRVPNHTILGVSRLSVLVGGLREAWLKPILYGLIALLLAAMAGVMLRNASVDAGGFSAGRSRALGLLVPAGTIVAASLAAATPDLLEYMTVRRLTLDANHFWVSCLVLLAGLILVLRESSPAHSVHRSGVWTVLLWAALVFTGACGGLILLKPSPLRSLVGPAYTGLDLGLVVVAMLCVLTLFRDLGRIRPREPAPREAA